MSATHSTSRPTAEDRAEWPLETVFYMFWIESRSLGHGGVQEECNESMSTHINTRIIT